ncbi:hypothetical protein ACFL35_13540 [Candidatus Riflebacteria bacterium]
MIKKISILVLFFIHFTISSYGKTKILTMNSQKQFSLGKLEGVAVSSKHRIVLGADVSKKFSTDKNSAIVALHAYGAGLIAASSGGHIFIIDDEDKKKIHHFADEIICCFATLKGQVIMGSALSGNLYSYDGKKVEKFLTTKEKRIMALLTDAQGKILIGTGSPGKLFRCGEDKKLEKLAQVFPANIISLATGKKGEIYFGTDEKGFVYKFTATAKDKLQVIYDSEFTEIRNLYIEENDNILVLASSFKKSPQKPALKKIVKKVKKNDNKTKGHNEDSSAKKVVKEKEVQEQPTSAQENVITFDAKENIFSLLFENKIVLKDEEKKPQSEFVEITKDGNSEKLFTLKQSLYFAYRNQENNFYIGGTNGRLFFYKTKNRELSLLAELPQKILSSFVYVKNQLFLGTANSGAIYYVHEPETPRYLSPVIDPGGFGMFGIFKIKTENSSQKDIKFSFRHGFSKETQNGWSSWYPLELNDNSSDFNALNTKYLQWKMEITNNRWEGALTEVQLSFKKKNLPPEFVSCQVFQQNFYLKGTPVKAPAHASPFLAFPRPIPGTIKRKNKKFKPQFERGSVSMSFQVKDPDKDELSYDIFLIDNKNVRLPLVKDYKNNFFNLESRNFSEGKYKFLVKVSDKNSNNPEETKNLEFKSRQFALDFTPPVVMKLIYSFSKEKLDMQFTAVDKISPLILVEYSEDGKKWLPMQSLDGLIDEREEQFKSTISTKKKLLWFRIADSNFNSHAFSIKAK